jgi:hypothetical protein
MVDHIVTRVTVTRSLLAYEFFVPFDSTKAGNAHDTRHTTHDTRHTTHGTRHTAHDTRHTTHG